MRKTPKVKVPLKPPVLVITNERCDKCSVKALYTVYKSTPESNNQLFLCGSHTRQYANNLLTQGFTIIPDTYKEYGVESSFVKETNEPVEEYKPDAFSEETLRAVSDKTAALILETIVPSVRQEIGYQGEISLQINITVDKKKELVEFDIDISPVSPSTTKEGKELEEKFKTRILDLTAEHLKGF